MDDYAETLVSGKVECYTLTPKTASISVHAGTLGATSHPSSCRDMLLTQPPISRIVQRRPDRLLTVTNPTGLTFGDLINANDREGPVDPQYCSAWNGRPFWSGSSLLPGHGTQGGTFDMTIRHSDPFVVRTYQECRQSEENGYCDMCGFSQSLISGRKASPSEEFGQQMRCMLGNERPSP